MSVESNFFAFGFTKYTVWDLLNSLIVYGLTAKLDWKPL